MFNKIRFFLLFLLFVLLLSGCGATLSGDSGIEPTEILDLDDEAEAKITIDKTEVVALDMRVPKKSGYKLVGASFDPEILQMVHYLEYDDDGQPRTQYMFQAVAKGSTTVLVKMQPEGGGDVEVYKQITVNVGQNNGLFD